ncbi:MAG: ATP synthase F1 subunit epsilon [Lachnospiraceae bacterium]|nr:ATP synthase F1 subunit epsilon [Lachnospiraceae bacterium]
MTFHLTIVTPDGVSYAGEAEAVYVVTTDGRIGILPGHTEYVAALGMGEAKVICDGAERTAACIGGMITAAENDVRIVATTFEWADEIDVERAKRSEARARALLEDKELSENDWRLAEARLKRALVRISAAK